MPNTYLKSVTAALAKLQDIEFDDDVDEELFKFLDEVLWDIVERVEEGNL